MITKKKAPTSKPVSFRIPIKTHVAMEKEVKRLGLKDLTKLILITWDIYNRDYKS